MSIKIPLKDLSIIERRKIVKELSFKKGNLVSINGKKSQPSNLLEKLNYIGVLTIEFFIDDRNRIYANELAPRVHNSGHITLDNSNIDHSTIIFSNFDNTTTNNSIISYSQLNSTNDNGSTSFGTVDIDFGVQFMDN